jgi:histidine triad (HIT) family protein
MTSDMPNDPAATGDFRVRPARPDERGRLLEVWERAVRATHRFLDERNIVAFRPLVDALLASEPPAWWVLATDADVVVGFLGFANDTIEALFIDPDHHRRGGGARLVAHAERLAMGRALAVDVNEQNEDAVRFYEALGFAVVGHSGTDAEGRPFPILHMRRASGAGAEERCVFCEIAAGGARASIVAEDAETLTFLDLRQFHPGHVLVVPRHHVRDIRDVDDGTAGALIVAVARAARAVDRTFPSDGLSVWHSAGEGANQEVPHLHFHVHPRRFGDDVLRAYPSAPAHPDRETLDAWAARLREAMAGEAGGER